MRLSDRIWNSAIILDNPGEPNVITRGLKRWKREERKREREKIVKSEVGMMPLLEEVHEPRSAGSH